MKILTPENCMYYKVNSSIIQRMIFDNANYNGGSYSYIEIINHSISAYRRNNGISLDHFILYAGFLFSVNLTIDNEEILGMTGCIDSGLW